METVLGQVDALATYKSLSPKNAMHLHLLAEEMLAMMRAITGNVNGEFWIEDQDDVYALHLKVDTLTDAHRREQLLSASSTGKNEATRGFMGEDSRPVPAFAGRADVHLRLCRRRAPDVRQLSVVHGGLPESAQAVS